MKEVFPDKVNATLLDYDAVMAHVKNMCRAEDLDDNNYKNVSKMLTLFALTSNFESLTTDEAWQCIVDGSNDQGIDAIYIEEDQDNLDKPATVYVFQTKAYNARDKVLSKNFSANDLDKLVDKFHTFIVEKKHIDQVNDNLRAKLQEIYSLQQNPKYVLGIITTGLPPSSDAQVRFFDKIGGYNTQRDYVEAEFIGLEKLASFLPQKKQPSVNFKLHLEGKYVEANAGSSRVLVGRVYGRAIAELVKEHGDKLFEKNVRGMLSTSRGSINDNIYYSAISNEEAPYFFILNNGITIVCDDLKYMSGQESPDVEIKSGQIVNGGQTSRALFRALYDNKLDPAVNVLVRLIESDESEVVDRITKATNRQNAVYDRDLRSNDEIQLTIKSYIYSKYGHYYESRKNEKRGDSVRTDLRIDAEKAAQAFYAYYNSSPATAKSSKGKLFNQFYEEIYDYSNDQLPEQLFFAYKLLIAIESLKSHYIERYPFVRDAMLTTLALMKNFDLNSFESLKKDKKDDYKQLKECVNKIMKATESLVAEEAEKQGSGFEKRRLFISPSTYEKIKEKIENERN